MSRKRRFTGALRRAIEVRERHCQHPSGCDTPVTDCDVDHRQPYSQGGMTSQENGEIDCRPHNRDLKKHNAKPKPKRPPTPPPDPEPDPPDDP